MSGHCYSNILLFCIYLIMKAVEHVSVCLKAICIFFIMNFVSQRVLLLISLTIFPLDYWPFSSQFLRALDILGERELLMTQVGRE